MRCAAVVVAAGRGSRFGAEQNKVLLPLGGRTVLERSLDSLAATGSVEALVVVAHRDDLPALRERQGSLGRGKVVAIVEGGARRLDSVAAGVRACPAQARNIAIHDAARPLIRAEVVERAIEASDRSGGAVVAVPAVDTVKRSSDGVRVDATLPRSEIFLAQTPQIFRREPFLRALEAAIASGREFTDDAAVAEAAGIPVEIVKGDGENLKITYQEDLPRAEAILAKREGGTAQPQFRVGTGFDVHRLVPGRRCVLGGIELASPVGPLGHSDGDALLHAIADALLGAAGLDDLGTLFSDKNPEYKDADSQKLLAECVARVERAGFVVSNVDAFLVLERPKIAPHREAMRAAIATILGVETSQVNVKGKTAEGLGALGAGDAVAVQATILLQRVLVRCVGS